MKRRILILIIAIQPCVKLLCQANVSLYSVSSLSEDLKKNANAVYRLDEGILEVTSDSKYTFKTRQVITLLNKNAAHHLNQTLYYNKFQKIENVAFKIYDTAGNLVRSYQKRDFNSRDYTDEMSLYTDDKLLYLEAASPGYPCTLDILCERKATSYIALPNWVIASPEESVEYSSFIVKLAPSANIKYRALNTEIKPSIETVAGVKTYKWITANIPASKAERDSYASYNLPTIELTADAFEYDGYRGSFKTWQSFGAWNYQLYEEPKPFNNDDIQTIHSLVANDKSDREKIKILYTYLQHNMRYVSIQLGIGGFKPFAVKYVNDKKYGDCKALTNYMRYVLKVAGINSYPALINAGYNKKPADADYPSDPFNHVILCVPQKNDSVWLECTSNNNEYGFLGSFTENKNALLLTEKGGVLVSTPKSKYINNVLSTKTIITLDDEGGSQVKSDLFCTGDFWNLYYQVMKQSDIQRKNIFINYLHYKMPEQFDVISKPDVANRKQLNLALSYDQLYDFKTGSKLFFKPRLNSISNEDIQPVLSRKFDYIFEFPYEKTDTTIYLLPPGITIDKLPVKKEMQNEYASYRNEYIKNESGNAITVIANLVLKKCLVPPADYLEVATFFQQVNRSETEKFVLKKN